MSYPKTVVVAVDFNKDCLNTLKTLHKMPQILGDAEIHFVHVFEIIIYSFDLTSRAWPLPEEQSKIEAEVVDRLSKLAQEILPKGHTNKVVVKCLFDVSAKERFCEYTKEAHAGMAVVATRGKHGIQGLFDSSFAQHLCKYSPASIFVLRPHHS